MKNVLLVANERSDAGYGSWSIEDLWVEISHLCAAGGGQCHLIYPARRKVPDCIQRARIRIHELDYEASSLITLVRLLRLVKRARIDCVYLRDKPFFSGRHALLRLFGARHIIVHDGTAGDRTPPRGPARSLKALLYRLPWFTADGFIAVSPHIARRNAHCGCIPSTRSHVVTNGIVPITRERAYAGYCHAKFRLPEDAVIVFTSGRARPCRQIDFILRCAARLIDSHPRVYFLYCGDGEELQELKLLARSLLLGDRFLFAGRRDDVRRLIPSCHIGMHASSGEALSLSILEYMSGGLATLVPDVPSVCQSIIDGENGLLYRADDLASACAALSRLIGDRRLRARLGRNAAKTIREKYHRKDSLTEFRRVMTGITGLTLPDVPGSAPSRSGAEAEPVS